MHGHELQTIAASTTVSITYNDDTLSIYTNGMCKLACKLTCTISGYHYFSFSKSSVYQTLHGADYKVMGLQP